MTYEEAFKTLRYEIEEEGHCSYIEEEMKLAINALEKQIPKKPPRHDRMVCPNCNSKARYGHPDESYCCHCGQALDWSDT